MEWNEAIGKPEASDIVVQWQDGWGHQMEKTFATTDEAYTEAQHILQALRRAWPNARELSVTVLRVMSVLTETGENVVKRI
jgi:hypothetical protein